jgi:hypothetical protein
MEHSALNQLHEARDVETSAMKIKKILYVGSLIASLLFGAQAFARGGGGGGGGHGGFGGGGHGGFTGIGTSYGGAVTQGSSYGGVGASAGSGLPAQTSVGTHAFRHGIGSGYGYGYGYGWGGYGYGYDSGIVNGGGLTYEPVNDSLPKYERKLDKERAGLPDSAFVKNYGTVRQTASKRSPTMY